MLSRSNRRSGYRRRISQRSRRGLITGILGGAALLATGAVVACSESATAPTNFSAATPAPALSKLGPLTVASAGAYHNAFLDFSFPRVRNAISKGGDHKQACKVIAQAMREFIVAYRLDADPRKIGDDIAGARCGGAGPKTASFSLGADGTASPEFDAVINEMAYAVELGQSAGELSSLFEQKVAYARANLDPTEADVIAATASVGLSSVEYWSTNYETQAEQLKAGTDGDVPYNRIPLQAAPQLSAGEALIIPATPRFWRRAAARVALADLKGAVHGGISGSRGGWQGVLVGAAIEGGAKSAGALIEELFQ